MQKGEQASLCGSFSEADFVSEYFSTSPLATDAPSAHGSILNDKTRTAIMKARIFFTVQI